MNSRLLLVVLFAAISAVGAAFLFSRMIPQSQTSAPVVQVTPPPQPGLGQRVIVAAVDLPAGTLLAANSLTWKSWPQDSVDARLYMVEGSDSLENQVGKVVRAGVRAGEPVVKANVISRGESGFLAAVLSPGMRAITLSVNAVVGVAGFVFPGDKVDIILSHDVQLPRSDGTAGTVIHNVSETIMRDVRVIGVDQRSNDQETQPAVSSVVTLEVAADAAERLALASKMGELRLALRSLTPVTDDNIELGGGSAADFSKAAEEEGHTLTLDSDLSKIIAPPSGPEANSAAEGRTRALNKVTVTRGSSSTAVEVR